MNGSNISGIIKELNNTGKLQCTEKDLEEYLCYGILIKGNDGYITRTGSKVVVDVIKPKNYRFNLDLSNLICQCEEIASNEHIKRIYCMTKDTYNKYKERQLIVTKSNVDYYRLFENELWRILII